MARWCTKVKLVKVKQGVRSWLLSTPPWAQRSKAGAHGKAKLPSAAKCAVKALSSKLLSSKRAREAVQAQCAKLCCQALQAQVSRFFSQALQAQ